MGEPFLLALCQGGHVGDRECVVDFVNSSSKSNLKTESRFWNDASRVKYGFFDTDQEIWLRTIGYENVVLVFQSCSIRVWHKFGKFKNKE